MLNCFCITICTPLDVVAIMMAAPAPSGIDKRPGRISIASSTQNGLSVPLTVLRNTIAALLAVVAITTFWFCNSASLPPCAEMIGGEITSWVALTLRMTRNVFSWPVLKRVM